MGLFIGSFLNVCIFRIPEGVFWRRHRSYCRSCEKKIPFYHNIPVLSFLLLRGRCAYCSAKISWQYPVVELLGGCVFAGLYLKFPFLAAVGGAQSEGFAFIPLEFIRYAHAVIFSCFLIIATVVDLRLMIIPDVISLGLVVTAPLVVYLHPELSWSSSLIGVLLGGGILYAVAWGYWFLTKRIGLGMGDVKFLAGIGAWLGYESVVSVLLYGALSGALVGLGGIVLFRRNFRAALPFGPFLAGAAFLYMIFGPELLSYFRIPRTG